jgi:hypothetical protein
MQTTTVAEKEILAFTVKVVSHRRGGWESRIFYQAQNFQPFNTHPVVKSFFLSNCNQKQRDKKELS